MDTKQWPALPPWPRRLWQGAVRGARVAVVIGATGLGLSLWAPDDFGVARWLCATVGAGVFAFSVMLMLLAPLARSRAGRIAAGAAAGAVLGVVSGGIIAASPYSWEHGPYWVLACMVIGVVLGRAQFNRLYDD